MIDIRVERNGPLTIAHLSGELTTLESKDIAGSLSDFAAGANARLLINLAGVRMIDSEGLSSLITLVNRARLSGGRVVLAAPSPFVANVFHVTRLDTWFDIEADVTSAEQKLRKG
jgi:anti-sigma B factor antagonist